VGERLGILRVEPDVGVTFVAVLTMRVIVMVAVCIVLVIVMLVFGMVAVAMTLVVVMLVFGMIVVAMTLVVVMLVFGMIVVAMTLVVVMIIIVMIIMGVGFERPAFTERDMLQAVRFHEGNHMGLVAKRIDGPVEECFQARSDPEDDIGALECAGVRWAQAVGVGRPAAFDDQRRRADALHDARDERMDGLDRRDDRGRVGIGVRSQKRQRSGQQACLVQFHLAHPLGLSPGSRVRFRIHVTS
jgi:hypothetical protein